MVGAHVDHLGRGGAGSLASGDSEGGIHHGADDNASGVGAMLEVADWLADLKRRGRLSLEHDVLLAAWSGEELGLLGSNYFVENFPGAPAAPTHTPETPEANGHESVGSTHGEPGDPRHESLTAYLNMDMVGRYREKLVVQGMGSSPVWGELIEKANVPVGLNLSPSNDSYLPTDATSFYVKGVPILSAFTGAHEDYHKPSDTPEKINYDDTQRIARFVGLVTRSLAMDGSMPPYQAMQKPKQGEQRAGLRAYLGTIPDYAQGDVKGVKLSGVGKGGPAEQAGVRGGDVIVKLAGKPIENIYDYTYAIEALKIGEPVEVVVRRGGEELTLTVTPGSRD
ncbi:MAG: M28 family peptidase [Planctomycetota bacterium]